MKWIRFAFVLLLLSVTAVAQQASPPAPAPDPVADAFADQTVKDWLAGKFKPAAPQLNSGSGAGQTDPNTAIQQQLEAILGQLRFVSAPKDTRVSFKLRRLEAAGEARRIYAYPITSPSTDDATLTVSIEKTGTGWRATAVTFGSTTSAIPDFVKTDWGGWLFAALSMLLLYACIAPTFWRRTLENSLGTVGRYRRVFIITNALLYGMYIFGTVGGLANPALVQTLTEFFSAVLSNNGIAELTRSSVPSAAFGIALNNLRAGILFASFIPGSFFAVPAYLINSVQFWFYGIALAPVGSTPIGVWLLHVPTIILELQAYIFVVASSGVMLVRIINRTPFLLAWRDYLRCLPLAVTILVLAAWYEAFEIIVLIPALLR